MQISDFNGNVPGNIRRIIKDKGLKQYAVAQRAGMTASNLTDMLKGRKIIKVSDIIALSTALDVGIPDFFQP